MIQPHHCPVCQRACSPTSNATQQFFPFCSERCRSVDLNRWWDGRYAIAEDLDPHEAELMQFDPDVTVQQDSDDET